MSRFSLIRQDCVSVCLINHYMSLYSKCEYKKFLWWALAMKVKECSSCLVDVRWGTHGATCSSLWCWDFGAEIFHGPAICCTTRLPPLPNHLKNGKKQIGWREPVNNVRTGRQFFEKESHWFGLCVIINFTSTFRCSLYRRALHKLGYRHHQCLKIGSMAWKIGIWGFLSLVSICIRLYSVPSADHHFFHHLNVPRN